MKNNFSLSLFLSALAIAFLFIACEQDDVRPDDVADSEITVRGGKGKGKGPKGDDGNGNPDPDPVIYGATYRIAQPDDPDPLYQFSFSADGTLVLLQSDSTVANWGSDFWGTWAEPFPFVNGAVHYIDGLTEITYQFEPYGTNGYDVTFILTVSPYTGGPSTTTVEHPGIYLLVE